MRATREDTTGNKWYEYTHSEYGLHSLAHDRGDSLDVGTDGFTRQGCRFYVNP
jgi:hypothetical protein